jgi:hypothetical protein
MTPIPKPCLSCRWARLFGPAPVCFRPPGVMQAVDVAYATCGGVKWFKIRRKPYGMAKVAQYQPPGTGPKFNFPARVDKEDREEEGED